MAKAVALALTGALIAGATAEAQQAGDTPVAAAETLRGHGAIAVDVINNSGNLSMRAVQALLEAALKDGGIEVLPARAFPTLRLVVSNDNEFQIRYLRQTGTLVSTDIFEIYTIRLEFAQLLPLAGSGSTRPAEATTWAQFRYGYASDAMIANALTNTSAALIAAFLRDYQSVNPQRSPPPSPTERRSPAPERGVSEEGPDVPVEVKVHPFSSRAQVYLSQAGDR